MDLLTLYNEGKEALKTIDPETSLPNKVPKEFRYLIFEMITDHTYWVCYKDARGLHGFRIDKETVEPQPGWIFREFLRDPQYCRILKVIG